MLSRTAANLFWIARSLERAETTARLLDVGHRNTLLPSTGGGFRNEWAAILQALGAADGYAAKFGPQPRQRDMETFLFFDLENPGSVGACLHAARDNARIVRTALTSQVWDAINGAYEDFRQLQRRERSALSLPDLTDWATRAATLTRGAIDATQLRDDGYHFLNLGYAIERADNTARILDVKYFVLLPSVNFVGSGLDTYQWVTLLRALSAHRAYGWAYGGDLTAARIAHFLILNRRLPRSLLSCAGLAADSLDHLSRGYGRSTAAQAAARNLLSQLAEATIEEVFHEGLHEFLSRFIGENAAVAQAVHEAYLTGEAR